MYYQPFHVGNGLLHVGNFFTFGYVCIYVFYSILCAMFIVPLHVGGGDSYNWSLFILLG